MVGALAGTLVNKRNYSINDLLRFTNSKSGNILASHRDNMLYNFYRDRKFLDHKCFTSLGIALIGFDLGMVAGAVISGAYFEINYHQCQTQLTPAPGTDLFCLSDIACHSNVCVITMILFIVLGLSVDINGDVNIEAADIEASFYFHFGYLR
jgi:hypothetical protein